MIYIKIFFSFKLIVIFYVSSGSKLSSGYNYCHLYDCVFNRVFDITLYFCIFTQDSNNAQLTLVFTQNRC